VLPVFRIHRTAVNRPFTAGLIKRRLLRCFKRPPGPVFPLDPPVGGAAKDHGGFTVSYLDEKGVHHTDKVPNLAIGLCDN